MYSSNPRRVGIYNSYTWASRSSGRGLVGGRGAVLGVDGLAGGDAEEALRLGDPESEGVGRGALALPGKGCHTDPLLGR